MSIYLIAICIILGIILLQTSINKNLHVLQQSFYHNSELINVSKITKAYVPKMYNLILMLTAAFIILIQNELIYLILILLILLNIYFDLKNKPKQKKKFIITKRVMITYAHVYLTMMIIALLAYKFTNLEILGTLVIIFTAYSKYTGIILVMVGNILATPILTLINKKYINEAKKIIKEHKNLKVIGITGSYGKTSTKNIVTQILSEKFSTVMTPKSFNTTLGVVKSIRENIKPYTEIFVCEMGAARVGEIKEICEIVPPDYSVLTSIGPQHLTTFKSMENIVKGKFEIVNFAKKDSKAILNIDNQFISNNLENEKFNNEIITYGINSENGKYKVVDIKMTDLGSNFTIKYDKTEIVLETKLLGRHNIYNIVCAVAISKNLGMTDLEIQKAVKKLKPIEHRLELKKINGILALDDAFNSNPEGSKIAIECLTMFKDKYKVLVTPGMIELGDKEYELNKKLGEYATKCDYVFLVGTKTTKPIKDGMDSLNYTNYETTKDIYDAFDKLNKLNIEKNNLIVLFENDLPDSYS